MATHKLFSLNKLKNHFNCGILRAFLYREMIRIGNIFSGLVSNFLLFLFGFLDRYLHRLEADENFGKYDSSYVTESSEEKDEILKYDWPRKKEKFQMFSEFMFEPKKKTAESSFVENFVLLPNTSKYEISCKQDLSGFVEEPKAMSFTIEEMFLEPKDGNIDKNGNEANRDFLAYLETDFQEKIIEKEKASIVGNNQISQIGDFWESKSKTGEKTEDSVQVDSEESDFGNSEKVMFSFNENIDSGSGDFQFSPSNSENEFSDYTEKENTEKTVQISYKETDLENEDKIVLNENNLFGYKETEKSEFSGEFSFSFMNSGLGVFDPIKGVSFNSQKVHPISYNEEDYFHIDEEPKNGREKVLDYSENLDEENNEEFIELDPKMQFSNIIGDENGNTFEEDDEFDILLEHQENIEKMKMEMKNSKMKGLPTILENCESLKIGEDLKPLKIDDKKLEHKDIVDEIQKVYKSYSEKMKKLDILNYQTLNSISFSKLKDPNHQNLVQKSSAINSMFPSKLRRIHADPILKSIFEMQKNLEIVYISQLCLTWETLRWEYEKTKELLEHDSDGVRSYNLVAGEFQQFQVLIQRFVENEQFSGPRVQNFANTRCELRIFLQVPIIKEDCLKEKKENNIEGKYEISITMLSDIIGETIRIFWEFLSADHKEDKFSKLKGLSPNQFDLHDPSDAELLNEIKATLYMKEKKLKDILRSGNCIVKKFQKQQEGKPVLNLLFVQTDLKLVSRVLHMSKLTTDQLLWCQNKLHKVEFSNRKVHLETSFLLFPF